jgi:signal peptidase I
VPADELWMMGDSRNNSADSRVPGHGAVPLENVIGQARLIVMPFDRFGTIAAVDPQTDAVGMAETMAGSIGGPSAALAVIAAVPALRRPRREQFLASDVRPPARRRRHT